MGAGRRAALGALGEDAAARWYLAAGYEIVARNWRCAAGEIDLITRAPDGTIVVCEVKTRSSDAFGSPFEAVTSAKQRRLRRLAARWLAQPSQPAAGAAHPVRRVAGRSVEVRFDVAAVRRSRRGTLEVEVLESAF